MMHFINRCHSSLLKATLTQRVCRHVTLTNPSPRPAVLDVYISSAFVFVVESLFCIFSCCSQYCFSVRLGQLGKAQGLFGFLGKRHISSGHKKSPADFSTRLVHFLFVYYNNIISADSHSITFTLILIWNNNFFQCRAVHTVNVLH